MKKPTLSQVKGKLDAVFSQYIRLRDCDGRMGADCISCGAWYPYEKLQDGHFISRTHMATRYDEANNHAQCMPCNVWRKGNHPFYQKGLEAKIGRKEVERLIAKSRETRKYTVAELGEMLDYYKTEVERMKASKWG